MTKSPSNCFSMRAVGHSHKLCDAPAGGIPKFSGSCLMFQQQQHLNEWPTYMIFILVVVLSQAKAVIHSDGF